MGEEVGKDLIEPVPRMTPAVEVHVVVAWVKEGRRMARVRLMKFMVVVRHVLDYRKHRNNNNCYGFSVGFVCERRGEER